MKHVLKNIFICVIYVTILLFTKNITVHAWTVNTNYNSGTKTNMYYKNIPIYITSDRNFHCRFSTTVDLDPNHGFWTTGNTQYFEAGGVWWLIVKPDDGSAPPTCFGAFIRDNQPPYDPTINLDQTLISGWTSNNVTITMHDNGDRATYGTDPFSGQVSEAPSGVAGIYECIDTKISDISKWPKYVQTTITTEGKHTIYGEVVDKLGNYTEKDVTFGIDKTPPTGDHLRVQNVTSTGFDVYIDDVQDSLSGLKYVAAFINGKYYSMNGSPTTPHQFTCHVNASDFSAGTTKFTVNVQASDVVDNVADFGTISVPLNITAPVAAFTVNSPILVNTNLTYIDKSYIANNTYGNKIVYESEWQWSTDNLNWTEGKPTSFDLSQFSSSVNNHVYYIREKIEQGTLVEEPHAPGTRAEYDKIPDNIWSDWCVQPVDVYRKNTAPVAAFTVSPNPQYITGALSYNDTSRTDDWDSIQAREWSYSTDGGATWSTATPAPQTSFNNTGTYIVRLRAQNLGNALSPAVWSDYAYQTVSITKPIAAFTVSPNTQMSGQPLTYNDTSATNILSNPIGSREWSYSTDGGATWSTASSTPQTNFNVDITTTIRIRLRVSSTLIGPYPEIWSDYAYQDINIYPDTKIQIDPTSCGWVKSITPVITYSGGYNANSMRYSVTTSTAKPSTWTNANSSQPVLLNTTGIYYIHADMNDSQNNYKYTYGGPYYIDSTPPSGTFSPVSQSWTAAPTTIKTTFIPTDANSGVDKWCYQLSSDGGKTWGAYGDYYTSAQDIVMNSVGHWEIRAYVLDKAGNGGYVTSGIYYISNAPTAQFTVSEPVLVNQTLNYNDTSYVNENGATIAVRNWRWSTDNATWSYIKPTSFDLSQFSTAYGSGTYYIQEQVTDSNGLVSAWSSSQQVVVYRNSIKPVARFTVSPTEQIDGQPLTYNDTSYCSDSWEYITNREWRYSLDGGITWTNDQSNPPNVFNLTPDQVKGGLDVKIQEKVCSSGNIMSSGQWSDYYEQTVRIKPDLTVTATVLPNPAEKGQKVTLNITTTGNAKYLSVYIPTSLYNVDPKNITEIDKAITEESIHTEQISYYVPLKAEHTIDENNNIVNTPYEFQIKAVTAYGTTAWANVYLDVKGSILDGIKTGIY